MIFSLIFPAHTFWHYSSRHLARFLPLILQKAFKKNPHVKYSHDSAQWLNKLLQNLNCKTNMRAMLLTSFVEVLSNLSQVSLILAEIWMIFNGFACFSYTGWTRRSGINFMSWSYVWDLQYLQVCLFYTLLHSSNVRCVTPKALPSWWFQSTATADNHVI